MKLFIYDTETMEVVATVKGDNNQECETKAASSGYGTDDYGYTYSPAFGTVDGLIDTGDVEEIE